jgi:hypothetical protein
MRSMRLAFRYGTTVHAVRLTSPSCTNYLRANIQQNSETPITPQHNKEREAWHRLKEKNPRLAARIEASSAVTAAEGEDEEGADADESTSEDDDEVRCRPSCWTARCQAMLLILTSMHAACVIAHFCMLVCGMQAACVIAHLCMLVCGAHAACMVLTFCTLISGGGPAGGPGGAAPLPQRAVPDQGARRGHLPARHAALPRRREG